MGGSDGGGALDTSQLLITRYRIGIRIVVLGWLAASTLTGVGNWFGDIGL